MSDASAAPAAKRTRPLSPHLQVYRWQLTMAMSILHRATGIALSVGTILLVAWLVAAAMGPEAYAKFSACISSPIGIFMLMGWSWSLMYHLCSGVRHLMWDTGKGLSLPGAYASGYAALLVSTTLTAVIWFVAWSKLS